jgi:hypothetical protein
MREWTRVDEVVEVTYVVDSGPTVRGMSRNLSANGILVDVPSEAVDVGAKGKLTLARGVGAERITIEGFAEVVRVAHEQLALHITALTGEESYAHLRNLIVYNAADEAAQAEQEFQEHIGLKRPEK